MSHTLYYKGLKNNFHPHLLFHLKSVKFGNIQYHGQEDLNSFLAITKDDILGPHFLISW